MKNSELLSSETLDRLRTLDRDFHARLGDDLYAKMRDAFPELEEEDNSAEKKILWWILHNQLEVIGRMERCKDSLRQVIDSLSEGVAKAENAMITLANKLDHLKQNLTFLTGDLGEAGKDTYGSFYILDSVLDTFALSQEEALKHYRELIEPVTSGTSSLEIRQKLSEFGQSLQERGCEKMLADTATEVIDKMLAGAGIYYAEMDAFVKCNTRPVILLYRFRRVESAGTHLLSTVIMAETVISTLKYFLTK